MPLVVPEGFAEVTVVYNALGDPSPSTTSWGVADVTTLADLQEAVEAWAAAWALEDGINGALSSSWTTISFVGRTDPAGSNLVYEFAVGDAGLGGADPMPSNCAVLVKKITGTGGRQNRGRMFIGGCLTGSQVNPDGTIEGAARSAFQDAVDTTWVAGNTSGHTMQLLHSAEIRNPALPAPAMMPNPDTDPDPVTAVPVDAKIATQRRRMR